MVGIAPDGLGHPRHTPAPMGPLVLWSAVLVAVAVADAAAVPGAPAGVAVGALAAALLLRPFSTRGLPTALAMLPLAVEPSGGVSWILAGAALTYATVGPAPAARPGATLRHQLAVARRRGEPASVLVAPVDRRDDAERLAHALRSTDAAEVLRVDGHQVVVAVLEEASLDRDALRARLSAALALPDLSCAWTRFPEDGATVEVLVDHALAHAPVVPQPSGLVAHERRLSLAEESRS